MRLLAVLLLAATTGFAQQVSLKEDFDAYLQERGRDASAWRSLSPDEQSRLLEGYLDELNGQGKRDEGAIELLEKLRDPDAMRRYTDVSTTFAELPAARGEVSVGPTTSAPEEPGAETERDAETAAGLSMLEKLRPGEGSPSPSPAPKKQPAIAAASGEPGNLDDVAGRSWGRELLEAITDDWTPRQVRTRTGALLTVEYADLSLQHGWGDAWVSPETGRYKIKLDRSLMGTEAELAIKAHELSHVRDAEELPDAGSEVTRQYLGLLMEYRANLYEVAVYLSAHPAIRAQGAPERLCDAEVWFKARVFAGDLDEGFLKVIPSGGAWAKVRDKAQQVLAYCGGRQPCGGMKLLEATVIDPAYAETDEGSILQLSPADLTPEQLMERDRAMEYQAETDALESRVRAQYGLLPDASQSTASARAP